MSAAVISVRKLGRLFQGWRSPSRKFEEEWQRFQARSASGIQGCWEGQWETEQGRQLPLKCVITRIAPGTYLGSFWTRLYRYVPFGFELPLRIVESGGDFSVEGSADFGVLGGGVYTLRGRATTTAVDCACHTRKGTGRFRLARGNETARGTIHRAWRSRAT